MRKIILVLSLIFTFHQTHVFADTCDTETMKKLMKNANNIKINYEVEEKTVENEDYELSGTDPNYTVSNILLDVYNLTDDIFIIVTNDKNATKKVIVYADGNNGVYKLDTYDNFGYIVNYTFNIYAKNDLCKGEKLRTIEFKKPVTNPYYYLEVCKQNLDVPLCAQFVTEIPKYDSTFKDYIRKYRETNTENISTTIKTSKNDSFFDNIKEYKVYFIIGFVSIFIVISLFILKKRNDSI